MGRRWRRRTYIKEVLISPEEVARRKAHAVQANADIADIQIPRLQADLARHEAIIEQFARSRGVPLADVSKLRELLAARQLSIKKVEEEARLAQQRLWAAKQEIEKIINSDKRAQGVLRRLFFGYTPSAETVREVALQREIIQQAESTLGIPSHGLEKLSEEEQAFIAAFDMAEAIRNSIRHHEAAKRKLVRMKEAEQEAKEAEQKRMQKEGLRDAIVAAFLAKTRDLADDIKKHLVDQAVECPCCPYCGGEYGDEPHADHIYPVSRGGLSTLENMVLVCGMCNLKKSDKTLREFIVQYKMDRCFIETSLVRLRKVF
jgi:5-methylcytosine-specific restriction endonuclease McrA